MMSQIRQASIVGLHVLVRGQVRTDQHDAVSTVQCCLYSTVLLDHSALTSICLFYFIVLSPDLVQAQDTLRPT